jgi:hypothetical protein
MKWNGGKNFPDYEGEVAPVISKGSFLLNLIFHNAVIEIT